MNRFSRISHHVSIKEVKQKRLEKLAEKKLEEKKIEEEKKFLISAMNLARYDWRQKIDRNYIMREGMTTGNMYTTTLPAEGDTAIDQLPPTDTASFADVNNMFGAGADSSALDGTIVRANGTGSGSNGGFNVGGEYLAFQGNGTGASRFALMKPLDATKIDTLTITAIRGNSSNGGEEADIVGQEELFVIYKTPDMTRSSYLSQDRNQNNIGAFPADAAIIAIGQGDGTLQDYTITIPEYARQKDTVFGLFQLSHSGAGFDHYGITDIKFQRKAPVNVVVPLDDPESISFVRVGTDEGDPKKRKKKVNDQLAASDEYTASQMGGEFPGQGGRIDGEDPFKSAEIQDVAAPSPIGKPAVTKSFTDFQKGPNTVEVKKTPEQIKAQNDEYIADLNKTLENNNYDYTDPRIIEIADEILKTDPKNFDAYSYKIGAQYETGDIEGALKTTDAMIKNNPDDVTGYELRSFIKKGEGDLAGAIEDLEKAIELDPDSEYIAYSEMELADLKFQQAEIESEAAEKERLESEAGAIEAKAHQDYWDNADLYEIEVPEIEPVEVNNWDKNESRSGILDLYRADYETAKATIANLPKQSETIGATYNADNIDYVHLSKINQISDIRFRSPESMSQEELQRNLISLSLEIEDQKNWVNNLGRKKGAASWIIGAPNYVSNNTKFTGEITGITQKEVEAEYDKLDAMVDPKTNRFTGNWEEQLDKANKMSKSLTADAEIKKLNAEQYKLVTQYNKLYDAFMGVEGEAPPEQPSTLYDQMKALYDEEDPDKEIKTELKELGFDKQYKDLMNAWSSKEKFSKFITPLANLSKAFGDTLGKVGKALDDNVTAGANNAQLENYKIAIAKSVLLNRPIRVDPTTISTTLKQKLAMGINPNMISTFDVENPAYDGLKEFKQDGVMKYDYIQENPDYEGDGVGVIPIVREPKPYADFNIYTDEAGNVYKQERSATGEPTVPNTTFQTDASFKSGFMKGALASITRQNPLASRGQAQYQIVVPPDGSEPYLLYEDHAYYNIDSQDPGEAPGLSDRAAKFVNWLGNTAYKRNDGDANTGGMAGYPPNIRGDVITKFRINASDLPRRVREAIYRHPFLSENPGIAQAIEDKLYNEREIKTMLGSKGLHNYYMNRQRLANTFKDFAVDKSIELIMGLPSIEGTKNDLRSASNMLQKYDDYIQATVFQPDGKTYIPGIVDADGRVQSRIDVTDQFTKNDQNHLKDMMFNDKALQILLKQYVRGDMSKKAIGGHIQDQFNNILSANSKYYRKVFANSLGKGTRVDIDQFLNGRLVLKKDFEFRDKSVNSNWVVETVANMFDVSTDTAAAGGFFTSLATMTAARHLLNPVRGPGILPGMKQTFRQAMNSAPTMPYKLEFDLSEKMMKILQGIEDKSREEEDLGVSATDAATLAAEKRRRKKNIKEQTLFERVKPKPFFNPKDIKPTFPEKPPGKIDPKTGMHTEYGKRARRFKKLDPMSANAMPVQGDPELDAVVNQQRTKEIPSKRREKYIKKVAEQKKYNWREDFTNITTGNKVGQTFRHNPTGATFTTSGGLGGVESTSKTVTLDLGFGDFFTVDAPSYDQLALAGFAKPILMKRRNTEDVNPRLNASQEFAKKANADVMMNARVEDSVDSALLSDLGYKSTEDILAEVGDLWTYEEYMAMLDAIADKAAAKEEPIVKKILEYSPTGKTPGDVPISLIDAQEAITNARNKAEQALHLAWERYNKIPEPQDGFGGGRRSNYTPQEIAQNRENLKNSIITTATGVIDGARNLNRVNYALNLAKRQSAKSGGSTRINTIPANSLGGRNNPVETKMHFQSKKAFIKSVDLNNTDYDIASQIVNNSADATQYALGFKAVHSQIPTEGGSQENNVKLNSKGDLEMFDNYAFRPDGYENFEAPVPIVGLIPGVPKIPVGKIAGKVDNKLGTEFQKDLATQIDKAGPVGWLSHALLGDIPDRQDPAVRIKTTITKKELIKILGAADYKIFVNRMNKERKKRKVNESNTFSKIKKFKNKY